MNSTVNGTVRKIWDIHGGIHPEQNKVQSLQGSIKSAGIPNELIYPLSPHYDDPTEAIVNIGEHVLKGQLIAHTKDFLGIPIHSATSGQVIAIEHRPIQHPSNMPGLCIIIKADHKDQWIEHNGIENYRDLDTSDLCKLIHNAGIAGMGGAGFPTAIKLHARPNTKIDTLIINGTECEPYITADDVMMRERAAQIILGVAIVQCIVAPSLQILPKMQTLIGVEDNKAVGIAALRKALGKTERKALGQADDNALDNHTHIVDFPTKYPSGGEKQLIQILTGREVPSGKLPADVGVVCVNISTCVAIYRAIYHGEPLISRITTVTGNALANQNNMDVLLGTPVAHLLKANGIVQSKLSRLILGGPMMGFSIDDANVPVTKTTNCIIAATEHELPNPPPAQACIRCGKCAEACPMSLLPQQLYWYARAKEFDQLQSHQLFDCIECGACAYVCPSNIPLVQYYRASKAEIKIHAEATRKAERARSRFEHREDRLKKITVAREEKRKVRKAASHKKIDSPTATTGTPTMDKAKSDIIQAAIKRVQDKKSAQEQVEQEHNRVDKQADGKREND